MDNHVTALGALMIAYGIIGLSIGAFVFVVLTGIGFVSGEAEAMFVLSLIGSSVALFFGVLGLPSVIGGIGLVKRRSWARLLVLIVAALGIFNFPFGTALAIYAFWVLSRDEVAAVFNRDDLRTSPSPSPGNDDSLMASTT